MTRFPLTSICPTGLCGSVTLCGQRLHRRPVTVSSRVVKRQLLTCTDVPSSKQRQSRNHRVHANRQHEEVRQAGVVEKAAYISHNTGVHKGLHNGARTCMLPYGYDVIIIFRPLCQLSALGLLKTDHLSCVLTNKRPTWDRLQRPYPPAPVAGVENLQPESQPSLDNTVGARVTAGAQDVALEHRWAVTQVCPTAVQQCAGAVVRLAVSLQAAAAALSAAGVGEAGASRKGDFAGVDRASRPHGVIWGILKNGNEEEKKKIKMPRQICLTFSGSSFSAVSFCFFSFYYMIIQ